MGTSKTEATLHLADNSTGSQINGCLQCSLFLLTTSDFICQTAVAVIAASPCSLKYS